MAYISLNRKKTTLHIQIQKYVISKIDQWIVLKYFLFYNKFKTEDSSKKCIHCEIFQSKYKSELLSVTILKLHWETTILPIISIDFASFYDFAVGYWNCSDSVVFWNCSDSIVDFGIVRQCRRFWNCSDSIVYFGIVPTVS